jgi:hypothetical protein
VREDGGYIGRHNPMILAKLNWTYFPYDFLNFNNNGTTVFLTRDNIAESFDLSQLPVTGMHVETAPNGSSASIYVKKTNDLFSYTQILTVYKGVRFVNMSISLESNSDAVSLRWVNLIFKTKGDPVDRGKTVGFFDAGGKVLGQLIFAEGQPKFYDGGPSLLYTFSDGSNAKFEVWASAFSVSDTLKNMDDPQTVAALGKVMADNLASYQQKGQGPNLDVFDYRTALSYWNVSYVAVRNSEIIPKFAFDPAFNLLFINDEVAIFLVK